MMKISMKPEAALKTLKEYNAWSRDRNDINSHPMPDPTLIGLAIDYAIEALEQDDYEKRGLEFENEHLKKALDAVLNYQAPEPNSWADENDAWIDSKVHESEDNIFSAGISTVYHGHCIEAHADTEEKALDLIITIFNSLSKAPTTPANKHENKVTRLEVIDGNGRSYVNTKVPFLELSYQDDGRTLKIFTDGVKDTVSTEWKPLDRIDFMNIIPSGVKTKCVDSFLQGAEWAEDKLKEKNS